MKKRISIILVFIWMILIFIMSSFNSTQSSNQSGFIVNIISNLFNINNLQILSAIIRKIAHFAEYFILGVLVYNMICNYNKKMLLAIIICLTYSVTDELHQILVPGRAFQLLDIIIDSIGSISGIYFLYYIKNIIYKKITQQ